MRIGREAEKRLLLSCLQARKNVLLEGPVGVGKTHLITSLLKEENRSYYRIDGDSRYSEQKLAGWFDPPVVLKQGYHWDSFIPGPLTQAMKEGAVLFINELNRLPDGVQNILLPAIDERMIILPRLGELKAHPDFLVVATQNPKEFIATSRLSEALLDRFEWISLDYPSLEEEREILRFHFPDLDSGILEKSLRLVRETRNHPKIKRGASLRAGISLCDLTGTLMKNGMLEDDAFRQAALMALSHRVEIDSERMDPSEIAGLAQELADDAIKKKA